MTELKPCPFCGSSRVITDFNKYNGLMLDGSTRSIGEFPTIEAAQAALSRLVNILGDEYNGVEVVR